MNTIQSLDNIILQYIQMNMRTPSLDVVMPFITALGSKLTIWTLIGVVFIITKKYRRYGFMIIFSLILCLLIGNLSLKPLIGRIRPFEAMPILDALLVKPPTDFSFPSGHTMSAFAASTVLFSMNKRIGIFALIISSLIGFSRLYLYVHYPSDVFCGMIIGILLGNAAIVLFDKIEKLTLDISCKN